ncbi:MAG: hypothetical protein ACOY3D_00890 [Candidatus Omnitrophota bacterium]
MVIKDEQKLSGQRLSKISLPKGIFFLEKLKLGKRYIPVVLPLLGLAAVGVVTVVVSSPLILQHIQLRQNIKVLDLKIKDYKNRIEQVRLLDKKDLERKMFLLDSKLRPVHSLSYALSGISGLAEQLGMKIVTINPGAEALAERFAGANQRHLKILPVEVNLQSEYCNFGYFLDNINRVPDCLIVVKGYSLHRDDNLLPKLSVKVELEAYILEERGVPAAAIPETGNASKGEEE